MYTYKNRYNYTGHFFYESCFEMPGKTVFPEKRSYYFGTEGVLISGINTTNNVQEQLCSIGAELKWDKIPTQIGITQAKLEQKQAYKKLSECRSTAMALRKACLDERTQAVALAEDTSTEVMLKKIRHREA
jgi:hypothetical protein